MRINIVSGKDDFEAYGDSDGGETHRYGRTREFLHLVRRLWTERAVTHRGEHYNVANSAAEPCLTPQGDRLHPPIYFGGAPAAAERVAAGEADVQLFWGEPRDGIAERIARLKALSRDLDRGRPPLQFGLRVTTFIRNTREQARRDAEAKVTALARIEGAGWHDHRRVVAEGQQRLFNLQAQGEVPDENLYTTAGKFGAGGAATTWLVVTAEEVASSLRKYAELGITRFILSDTPYQQEIERQGRTLLPLPREEVVPAWRHKGIALEGCRHRLRSATVDGHSHLAAGSGKIYIASRISNAGGNHAGRKMGELPGRSLACGSGSGA